MTPRRWILVIAAVSALTLGPHASASPYNEQCGDGTPHGCVQHCLRFHGGLRNLADCLWAHYLV